MKKVLITGANSYLGSSFERFIDQWKEDYLVDTIDMIDGAWRKWDFSQYDVIYHVAGIAHQRETKENASSYYKINRDLAVEVARYAKKSGVKQFIFLSSMSVYGLDVGVITKETIPNPKNNYGKSKYQAEKKISSLADPKFRVTILRPPMVFGPGCRGNFQQLVKIIALSPVFPKTDNKRSLVYIDNLSSFVKLAIDKELSGVFFPSNSAYITTYSLAKAIAGGMRKKIYFSSFLGICASIAGLVIPKARKAFGTLVYKDVEDFGYTYCIVDNKTALKRSAVQDRTM